MAPLSLMRCTVLRTIATTRRTQSGNTSTEKKSPSGSCRTGKTINLPNKVGSEVPLNLGTKQPALVGFAVGIRRRSPSASIATFLNRRGGAFQRVTPDRIGRKHAQLRTGIIAAFRLDRRSDGEYCEISAAAKSRGAEGSRIRNGKTIGPTKGRITVRLKATDVIYIIPDGLTFRLRYYPQSRQSA